MLGWITNVITGGSDREAKRLLPVVAKINALEPAYARLSDEELRAKTVEFRRRLGVDVETGPTETGPTDGAEAAAQANGRSNGKVRLTPHPGKRETLDDLLPDAFAAVREAAKRSIGMRHFDVQLIGGAVLHQGKIAEMKTGEGKTLVASLPLYLNALLGQGCHLVTPNDYLARVGGGWMGPAYHLIGLSVSVITPDFSGVYDPEYVDSIDHGDDRLMHWRSVGRREAYRADIMYGTNHEFAFDYLRDNMVYDVSQLVQRDLYYAIVDEVDSILIDEARTPHIISGPAEEPPDTYYKFARVVTQLQDERDYTVDLKMKSVLLTDEGIEHVERLVGVENIYGEQNYHLVHYLEQALKANVIFRRDRDYVLVKDGRVLEHGERVADADVVIVDEFTGRLMFGRRYSEGLHQALEAKEGVRIQRENLTVATITLQNFFRMYKKLAGMTGTAATEAEEFRKIYNLDVVPIPTHRDMIREDDADLIYKTAGGKLDAIVDEIEELHDEGRPVLVGTTSVEKSEYLSRLLERRGVPHEVLNAKYHEREAMIVAGAGRKGAVTLATNMAGRGTDIILGGPGKPDPSGGWTDEHERLAQEIAKQYPTITRDMVEGRSLEALEVLSLGGLHIIATERHEARRIDNQLRGRAGRQGDPGSSRFYLSLEDDLMRRFGSDRIGGLMERLGLEDDQPIEHSLVSKSIETAQQKVEGYNFDIRKHTLEYDDVMNKQREVIYGQRRRILEADDLKPIVLGVVREQIKRLVEQHTESPRPDEWDIEGLYNAVASMFGPDLPNTADDLSGENRESLQEVIAGWADELYTAKERQYSPALMQYAARGTLLRIIDGLWMEHLTAIDDIIAGIGLRAYGQRDPLTEYKGEAYRMFQSLLGEIQSNIASAIFRIQFVVESLPQAAFPGAAPASGSSALVDPAAEGSASGAEGPEVSDQAVEAVEAAVVATAVPNASDGPAAEGIIDRELARRASALAQPPATMRHLVTNQPRDAEPVGARRPAVQDGKAMTRAERNRQEEQAKRLKQRALKRARQRRG